MVIIISGHQRSGTTLLRRLCDAHPQMKIANEFGCFADVDLSVAQALRVRSEQLQLVNGRWAFDSQFANCSPSERQIKNAHFMEQYCQELTQVAEGRTVTLPAIVWALQKQWADMAVIGDKWPQYMPLLPKFVGIKGVRVVVIYRDCRDVASSFLEKVRTEWRTRPWASEVDTAAKIARNWVEKIEMMAQLGDQIYSVQYEALVSQPERVLPKLGRWLGVDPDGFNWRAVRSSSVGKYREGLTDKELSEIWAAAGETMRRLGYENR